MWEARCLHQNSTNLWVVVGVTHYKASVRGFTANKHSLSVNAVGMRRAVHSNLVDIVTATAVTVTVSHYLADTIQRWAVSRDEMMD